MLLGYNKPQKRGCRTIAPSAVASLELLAHPSNVVGLILFYRYYVGRFSSKLAEIVQHPYSCGRSTLYSYRLHDFSATNRRCYKDVYVISLFPHTASLWSFLPAKWSPLTSLHKIRGFPLRISSVNVTKSAVSCGFGHICWGNPHWKTSFLCSAYDLNGSKSTV